MTRLKYKTKCNENYERLVKKKVVAKVLETVKNLRMLIFLTQIYRLIKIDWLIFTDTASQQTISENFKAKRLNCLSKSVNPCQKKY